MAARKKLPEGSTKKPIKKEKTKKAAAPKDPAAAAGAAQIGHNSRIPTAKEMEGYFKRLDALHTQKQEANARYMTDIKAVYEEASNKFGSSRKIMRILYAQKKAAEAHAEAIAEMEQKERDDYDRLTLGAAKAFGEDTPFGAFLAAEASVRSLDEKNFDEVHEQPANVVPIKSAAQAALEAIEKGERTTQQEQQSH